MWFFKKVFHGGDDGLRGRTWQPSPKLTGSSSLLIQLTESEIRAIHVWQGIESLVCQRAGHREHDFASSIKVSGVCAMLGEGNR